MDPTINIPPNSRPITKREIALGILSKPIYKDFDVKRYLQDDDIVSFTIDHQTNDFNTEFVINNNKNWRIWLSQLNNFFISADSKDVYQGYIRLKNGIEYGLANMELQNFLNIVKGRKFKAIVTSNLYAINRYELSRCGFEKLMEGIQYIWQELDAERYENVKGLTKSAFCYSLDEI